MKLKRISLSLLRKVTLTTAIMLGVGTLPAFGQVTNGNFETGSLTGWTSGGIDGGVAFVVQEGACWSSFNTTGITLNGNYAVNVRSSGPAPLSSIGILTSNPFVATSAIKFNALSETAYNLPNPVTLTVEILNSNNTVVFSQVMATNIINLPFACSTLGPNEIFSAHTIDTSAFAGQTISLRFQQHTNYSGYGFFTLVDDVQADSVIVGIDIKPGSSENPINPKSQGNIPVAILTTANFDAATVDPTTVLFGSTNTKTAPIRYSFEDVDGDGDMDMILHFDTQATGIVCGDTSASLTGRTFSGQPIMGSDSIKTPGC